MLEVIIPVHNGGDALSCTLTSLADIHLKRKYTIRISDNYSTDNKPWLDVLSRLIDWKIELIKPPKKLNRIEHWNWLFSKTQEKWIKPLMVGDLVKENFFEDFLDAIEKYPDTSIIFCTNEEHRKDKVVHNFFNTSDQLIDFSNYLNICIEKFNFIGSLSGVVINRNALNYALPFNELYPWTADWRFYTRCASFAPLYYIRSPKIILNRKIVRYSSKTIPIIKGVFEEVAYWKEIWEIKFKGQKIRKNYKAIKYTLFQLIVKISRIYLTTQTREILINVFYPTKTINK